MSDRPDTASLRRRLAARHRELRDVGQNPIDALLTISIELLENPGLCEASGGELMLTAFQQFLTGELRGAFGQYLTPPAVAAHAAGLAIMGGRSADVALDPFVGSGILLDAIGRVSTAKLTGCEINPTVARVGEAANALSGRQVEIVIGDAFARWVAGELPRADLVITNPPFGAHLKTIEVSALPAKRLRPSVAALANVPVEILAIELALDRLSPDGRLVAVLPLSVLTNRRLTAYRGELFAEHRLVHVTTLPEETFAPYRGVANACVVVIDKKPPASASYPVTFEASRSVGYDATGRSAAPSDLDEVLERVRNATASLRWTQLGEVVERPSASEAPTLGEVADIFVGKTPGRDEYVESGPFLLKVGGLSGSFVSWRERARTRVPEAFYRANPDKQLRPGDICFTCAAHTPKYIAQKIDLITSVPLEGAIASREVMTIRLRPGAPIDPVTLLYYLRSSSGQAALRALVRGSTAHLYAQDVGALPVPSPDVDRADLRRRHERAEAAFRQYRKIEDEIVAIFPG